MAPSSKTNTPEKILSLCVKNLPPNMDYDMLKKIIPSAKKLMLRKKSNFMRAFITFSSKEGHKDALHRLKGVEFDGIKPVLQSFYHQPVDKHKIKPENVELTIQNLPQTITLAQLKKEFPTAVSIKLMTDLWDVQKRSCLLTFQCSEDLEDVFESCHHKVIGGETIKAIIGAQATLYYESSGPDDIQDTLGIEIVRVASEVDDDQIRGHFPKDTLVEYHSVPNSDSDTRNVFIRFKKQIFNWPLIITLKNNVFSGTSFQIRPWDKSTTLNSQSDADIKMNSVKLVFSDADGK